MTHRSTKYTYYSIIFTLLCMVVGLGDVYSQQTSSSLNACVQEAESEFRRGNPENTIQIVEFCLATAGRSPVADKVSAHLLLTLAYLENNQKAEAEYNFERLLYWDPEFDISKLPSEDADLLRFLYQSYQTDPVIYLGGEMGANSSGVDVLQQFGAARVNTSSQDGNYGTEPGIQLGLYFSLPIKSKNFRFMSGVSFLSRSYKYQEKLLTSTAKEPLNFATLTTRETQSVFQVPLLLSIDFDRWNAPNYQKNTWVPYIYGGASVDYLFASRMSEISRINLVGASENGLSDPQIGDMRRRVNYSLIIGGGLKFKFGLSHIFINVRYTHGINNLVDPDERYSNGELLYLFGYVDDDFRMRTFSISLGMEKSFYNPKKLRRK